jgi:hypothetical protein
MKPLNVELLLSHDSGISEFYWRPTEKEVLADYLKAVPLLSINDNKSTLQKQVVELTEKSKHENYVIREKLTEKERETESTKKQLEYLTRDHYILNRELIAGLMSVNNVVEAFTIAITAQRRTGQTEQQQPPPDKINNMMKELGILIQSMREKKLPMMLMTKWMLRPSDIFRTKYYTNIDDKSLPAVISQSISQSTTADSTIRTSRIRLGLHG